MSAGSTATITAAGEGVPETQPLAKKRKRTGGGGGGNGPQVGVPGVLADTAGIHSLSKDDLDKLRRCMEWCESEQKSCMDFCDYAQSLKELRVGAMAELCKLLGNVILAWDWETDFDAELRDDDIFLSDHLTALLGMPGAATIIPFVRPIPDDLDCPQPLLPIVTLWQVRMITAAESCPKSVATLTSDILLSALEAQLNIPLFKIFAVREQFAKAIKDAAPYEVDDESTEEHIREHWQSYYIRKWCEGRRYALDEDGGSDDGSFGTCGCPKAWELSKWNQ